MPEILKWLLQQNPHSFLRNPQAFRNTAAFPQSFRLP
jgi:hypothetical protein